MHIKIVWMNETCIKQEFIMLSVQAEGKWPVIHNSGQGDSCIERRVKVDTCVCGLFLALSSQFHVMPHS